MVSRWKHEVQIAILRRRAAMARAVLRRVTDHEPLLLVGQVDRAEGDNGRAPPLDEDDESTDGAASARGSDTSDFSDAERDGPWRKTGRVMRTMRH